MISTVILGSPVWAFDPGAAERVRSAWNAGTAVDCAGCDLSSARLIQGAFGNAQLAGADLSRADLSGADLSGADLSGAKLRGANLIGADMSDANLLGADITDAFFRSTRFCRTVMPDGVTDNTGC